MQSTQRAIASDLLSELGNWLDLAGADSDLSAAQPTFGHSDGSSAADDAPFMWANTFPSEGQLSSALPLFAPPQSASELHPDIIAFPSAGFSNGQPADTFLEQLRDALSGVIQAHTVGGPAATFLEQFRDALSGVIQGHTVAGGQADGFLDPFRAAITGAIHTINGGPADGFLGPFQAAITDAIAGHTTHSLAQSGALDTAFMIGTHLSDVFHWGLV
jgi:hypothetical protein